MVTVGKAERNPSAHVVKKPEAKEANPSVAKDTQDTSKKKSFGKDSKGLDREQAFDKEKVQKKQQAEVKKQAEQERSQAWTSTGARKASAKERDSEFKVSIPSGQSLEETAFQALAKYPELNGQGEEKSIQELIKEFGPQNSKAQNTELANNILGKLKGVKYDEDLDYLLNSLLAKKMAYTEAALAHSYKFKEELASIRPELDAIEAKAQSDDRYFSGLLSAISGESVSISTSTNVKLANIQTEENHRQINSSIRAENDRIKTGLKSGKIGSKYERILYKTENTKDVDYDKIIKEASLAILTKKGKEELADKNAKKIQGLAEEALKPYPELKGLLESFNESNNKKDNSKAFSQIMAKISSVPEAERSHINQIIDSYLRSQVQSSQKLQSQASKKVSAKNSPYEKFLSKVLKSPTSSSKLIDSMESDLNMLVELREKAAKAKKSAEHIKAHKEGKLSLEEAIKAAKGNEAEEEKAIKREIEFMYKRLQATGHPASKKVTKAKIRKMVESMVKGIKENLAAAKAKESR